MPVLTVGKTDILYKVRFSSQSFAIGTVRLALQPTAHACIPRAASWSCTAGGRLTLLAPSIEVQ